MIPLEAIEQARERIAGDALVTPLVPLETDGATLHLKLETLQPIGSFKIRGAAAAIRAAPPAAWRAGVWTASAGNMAQGVAWMARRLSVPATIVVPETAPRTKRAAIERLGGRIVAVPYDVWWRTMETGRYPGLEGLFVHPVRDEAVMAGNGTIGLEIVETLGDVDTVVVPWGGGGLATGIASALRQAAPAVRVVAVEPETGAPLAASFAAGTPVAVDYLPCFVDGAGSRGLLPGMWERARPLLAGAVTASLAETAAAIRLLVERTRIVAEGAGALAVAAALAGRTGGRRVACVVSGGNIDTEVLRTILGGGVP